jgi:hypothetical protein
VTRRGVRGSGIFAGLCGLCGLCAAGLVLGAAACLVSCTDETHEEAVKALGPEDPNVSPGPLHRPGQPCVTCHGGSGPASQQFSIGGTVYATQGQTTPATNATVSIEDITGATGTAQTNEVGNFYLTVQQWQPSYPILPHVTLGQTTATMSTHVGRDGSCADCHQKQQSPTSIGPIFVKAAP